MAFSIARFYFKGWIEELYVAPSFHFSYYGFQWVHVPPALWLYTLFAAIFASALFITFGFFYRVSTVAFFLLFTYAELMDVTTYLNHYYFISLVAFTMIWLPANRRFSLDASWLSFKSAATCPVWMINIIKFQLFIVYFYAGIAKLNTDWLLQALPLKIWLPARSHFPLIGSLLKYEITAYVLSWSGALYDLFIPFLLMTKRIRPVAFLMVVIFHAWTALLFPIGMFPYIMTLSVLIFFSADFHERMLTNLEKLFGTPNDLSKFRIHTPKPVSILLISFCCFQLLFPLRHLLYPGHLFWTEEGYRFSWRVMLIEKTGYATFTVTDAKEGTKAMINNADYLTPLQEKEMSSQPDLILQFAHFLADVYRAKGFSDPQVQVDSRVTLNGQRSKTFIDPTVNLAAQYDGWSHKSWILPFSD